MIEMISDCIFCDLHEIDVSAISMHIAISESRDIEIVTLPLTLCPWAEKDIKESELLLSKRLKHGLYISIYKLPNKVGDAYLRAVFSIKGELRVSDKLSIDKTIRLIDDIKMTILTYRIESSRKRKKYNTLPQKTREEMILNALNEILEPIYDSLRGLRKGALE